MAPKYYKKRYYRGGRDKYSIEQNAVTVSTNATGDGGVVIVPPATIQGMRKVKHLTVSMAQNNSGQGVYWAIVYVPQGTTPSTIQVDAGAMYEPNQYVMCCGIFDVDAGPMRVHCPLSRNLNSGDSIYLILRSTVANTVYNTVVRYAVTLQ